MTSRAKFAFLMLPAVMIFASGGGGESEGWLGRWLLSYDFGLSIWSIITFFVVLAVLRWKAWGPLTAALDAREKSIKESLEAADRAKADADKVSQDYDEMIRKARIEAQEIVAEAKKAGEKVKNDIEAKASSQADVIVQQAKVQIENEKTAALKEIKTLVVDFSLDVAGKLIEKNLDADDNHKFVEQTLTKFEG
ncbi:MAG: F0F1 ATP synthase subunit B [Candidatus Marinimicrobia bacterium]|nr:F0F1 ATP synthase subunit B [Candidatus Neomarinimicrobiota bacterium]